MAQSQSTKYETLLEELAKHLYERAYASLRYRKGNPWTKMSDAQKIPYHEIAMHAMGKLLGPGKWTRNLKHPKRVIFVEEIDHDAGNS